MTDPSTLAGELSDEERALLDALWGALEAQDVSFDNGDNTWIDGHFEKGQLAFNMIARLRLAGYTLTKLAESGLVLVPREPTEAMVLAAQDVEISPSRIDGGCGAPDLGAVKAMIREIYRAMLAATEKE